MISSIWNNCVAWLPTWDSISAVIQVLILSVIVYWVLRLMRHSRGLWQILGLLFSFLLAYIGFDIMKMAPLALLFKEALSVAFPILVIVIYRDEVYRVLDTVGCNVKAALTQPWCSRDVEVLEAICASVGQMSKTRTGCLLVIENVSSLSALCVKDNSKRINAEINKQNCILETLFFKGTPLHDGGVVIQGNIIIAAAVQFPLSTHAVVAQNSKMYGNSSSSPNKEQEQHARKVFGLRHQAAQGVSERYTDALVVVVSEETGDIHYFHDGKMSYVTDSNILLNYLAAELCPKEMQKNNDAKQHPAFWLRAMRRLENMIQRS